MTRPTGTKKERRMTLGNRRPIREKPKPNHLRAWREAAGYTQAHVEARYGWKQGKMSSLERGMARITNDLRERLSILYSCHPDDLLEPPPLSRLDTPIESQIDSYEGVTALADTLTILQTLRSEMRMIRRRLDILEPQLDAAVNATAKAVRTTTDLALMFERGASTLKRTIHQTLAKSPPLDTVSPQPVRAVPAENDAGD